MITLEKKKKETPTGILRGSIFKWGQGRKKKKKRKQIRSSPKKATIS